uniref:MADF domain-containing protein n=1 Tax=Bactrocera dorsalis TaxID=27457 RepID=A0A034WLX8_BACDO
MSRYSFLQRSTNGAATTGKRFRRLEKVWTHDEQKILIDYIASRPALWDPDSDSYRNRDIRKKIWTEIAEVTKHSVNDAKNYWNNLRSRFNTERRKAMLYEKKHNGNKYESGYEFYSGMQFLTKIEPRRTAHSVEDVHIQMNDYISLESHSPDESDTESIPSLLEPKYETVNNDYSDSNIKEIFVNDSLNQQMATGNNYSASEKFVHPNEHNLDNFTMDPLKADELPARNKRKLHLGNDHEVPVRRKWKQVFSEYILCELERYEYSDAQRLKAELTSACLNFQPQHPQLNDY